MDFVNCPKPGALMRLSTNPVGFVETNGLAAYRKQFNEVVTAELLEADKVYTERWGPKVTKKHIIDYIRYWGVEHYIANCSPDSTYASVVADEDYCAAQTAFYCKPIDEVEVGMRTARRIPDPYIRRIRDSNGVLMPEPPVELVDDLTPTYIAEYGEIDKDYIYIHGIVNYVLYSGIKIPLTTLLSYRSVACWQRAYIEAEL
jgi:hypothetical protein